MDFLEELAYAIDRIITVDGVTATDAQVSFCDVQGFTPDEDKVLAGLGRLVARGSLRHQNGRWFDPSLLAEAAELEGRTR